MLITGAARGIGASLAQRLSERGAVVALAGLEPELLAGVAQTCGRAPWWECDVADRDQVDATVATAVAELGGLDVVVANAGVGAQMPMLGGDPQIFDRTLDVNVRGVYNTLRAAAPHIAHPRGYALPVSSLAAAVHIPMLGAYNASKSAVEALGNTLRAELRATGAKVGVAYFSEIDTDMTARGFDTDAARSLAGLTKYVRITPLPVAIDALERGIAWRARRIVSPRWVAGALRFRMLVQPVVDVVVQRGLADALEIARAEDVELTTPQPPRP